MGSRSSSRTSTTETNQQIDESRNFNLQDTEGMAVAAGGDVDVQITDGGAIEAMANTAGAALDATRDVAWAAMDDVVEVAGDAFDFSRDAGQAAIGLVGDVVDTLADSTDKAIDAVTDTTDRSLQTLQAATRSDTAAALETVAKYAALAAGVIGLAVVLRGRANG
ncbi:MAG TPA: hypothetical protein ENJ79_07835 [Gammaproteobacteria bacterium]|nr:hypothetical protein [Gammaproteobacteria bacterium]